jgi:hypothetical protein
MERPELDAQSSAERPRTGFDIIADKWNDPNFNPQTKISSCHDDFKRVHDLSHMKVAHITPADSLGIRNRLSSICSVLLRIIQYWEESGQGDGGRRRFVDTEEVVDIVSRGGEEAPLEIEIPDGVCWGALDGRTQEALDNRGNFLQGQPSWYLYFWELADSFQLLNSTVQRLSGSVGAADGSVASCTFSNRKKKRLFSDVDSNNGGGESLDTERVSLLLERIAEGGERAIEQEEQLYIKNRIDNLKNEIDEYEIKFEENQREIYTRIINRKKAELQELEKEL